jgi:AraC-like DNA-binding protein
MAALSVEFMNGQTLTETPLPIPLWKVALELREQEPDWLFIDELLAAVASSENPGTHCGSEAWLSAAKDILDDQYRKPPTLAELAYEVGISPNHLCAQFRNRYGKTISSYVREQRVTASLQAAPMPNAWVAGGFYDASHFRRDARRVLGKSPRDIMSIFAEP